MNHLDIAILFKVSNFFDLFENGSCLIWITEKHKLIFFLSGSMGMLKLK